MIVLNIEKKINLLIYPDGAIQDGVDHTSALQLAKLATSMQLSCMVVIGPVLNTV